MNHLVLTMIKTQFKIQEVKSHNQIASQNIDSKNYLLFFAKKDCRSIAEIISLILFLVFFVWGCASTGVPTGGPKDVTPPFVKGSNPKANTLNFKGKEVVIEFDEIIQLKEIFQKFVISPPVNKRPVITARGKELVIRFEEDLQANTTYTLDFADAIVDNNEGNILQNFRFSFSTGMVVDSLMISGFLFDAENLAPVADAIVMVHSNLADSALKTQVPIRLAKTNKEGAFSIQNVAHGQYRVYALEDANRNYLYDQPGERIAWNPLLIEPTIMNKERLDSIAPDSFQVVNYKAFLPDSLKLFMFKEDNESQYLKDSKRPSRNKIDFIFNKPNVEKVQFNLRNNDPKREDWFIFERSLLQDSLTLWLTDSTLINSDSLFVSIQYAALDSLKQPFYKRDSLNAFFFEKGTGQTRQSRRDKPQVIPTLKPANLMRSLELLGEFDIVFPTPVYNYNLEGIRLYQKVDTTLMPIEFSLVRDSMRIRRFVLNYPWEPGVQYEFVADSAAFTDVYGLASESITHAFNVKSVDSYGVIFAEVLNPQKKWIIQILNQQNKLVRQAVLPSNGKIGFQYLKPGDYFIGLIEDSDENEMWSIGDFEKGIQPERIMYFPELVNVRANWERLVKWDPVLFDIHDFVKRNRSKSNK